MKKARYTELSSSFSEFQLRPVSESESFSQIISRPANAVLSEGSGAREPCRLSPKELSFRYSYQKNRAT